MSRGKGLTRVARCYGKRVLRVAGASGCVALIAVICTGCGGSGRSTGAFCRTMTSEQHRILSQFHATANADPGQGLGHALAGLGATFEVLSALRTYFDKLSDVAPPTIEDQAKIVAKSYDDQLHDEASQAGDPLGALMSGLLDGAEYSSQLNDMNQFALQHCGHSV